MTEPEPWISTEATVTTCRYVSPALRAMAFGIPTNKNFRITFDYYAHGRLYSDEFRSATAVPQNTRIPLTYNPLAPEQNSRSNNPIYAPPGKPPLIAIGIAGSVVLSLAWLAILRACR